MQHTPNKITIEIQTTEASGGRGVRGKLNAEFICMFIASEQHCFGYKERVAIDATAACEFRTD